MIASYLCKEISEKVSVSHKIIKNGSIFEVGGFVLVERCTQYPIFGLIKSIINEEDECYFVLQHFSSEYVEHFCGYKLIDSGNLAILDCNDVKYFQCFYPSISFCNDLERYIILPVKFV